MCERGVFGVLSLVSRSLRPSQLDSKAVYTQGISSEFENMRKRSLQLQPHLLYGDAMLSRKVSCVILTPKARPRANAYASSSTWLVTSYTMMMPCAPR